MVIIRKLDNELKLIAFIYKRESMFLYVRVITFVYFHIHTYNLCVGCLMKLKAQIIQEYFYM